MGLGSRAVAFLIQQYRHVLQKMRGLEWAAQQIGLMFAEVGAGQDRADSGGQRFGRAMALASPLSTELLEPRMLLAAISWTGGGDGTSWTDVRNWSGGALPGSADDVTIGAGATTVTLSSGTQSIQSLTLSRALTITGGALNTSTVVDNGTLTFNRNDTVTLSSAISGSGSLTMVGYGTLILTGNNTYSGGTTITNGTLQVGSGGTSGSLGSSSSIVDSGTLTFNRTDTATVSAVISGSGSLIQSGSGTTILTGNNTYSGSTTISNGTLQVGNGGTSGSLGTAATISLTGTSSSTPGTLAYNRSDTVTVSATIVSGGSNYGNLVQQGTGTLVLNAANTFGSNGVSTRIKSGTLVLGNSLALQKSTLDMNAADSGVLDFGTLSSVTLGGLMGSRNLASTNDSSGAVALTVGGSGTATYSGVLSGSGSLTMVGYGTLILTGNNTYSGTTRIVHGTLQLGGSLALQNSTLDLNSADAGALALGSLTAMTLGGLQGSRSLTLTNTSSNAVALTAGGNSATTTYGGVLGGKGGISKIGSGSLILSGADTFTGNTSVLAGALQVDGSLVAASTVTVSSGATLSGNGTVAGAVSVSTGGTVQPDGGLGVLRLGSLSLANGSIIAVGVNGDTLGTQYGQISVAGAVSLAGATLQLTGTRSNDDGKSLVLLALDGTTPSTGAFAGLPQGATVTLNGLGYSISYSGGDGNDIALVDKPLPPTVASPATATPAPVSGTSAALSVLGADFGGESNLTYTWALTGTPPASVTFSANGTNAAKNTTATFTKAGSYTFQVTITDANNLTATSSVTVQVAQAISSISVTPGSVTVGDCSSQQFSAVAFDQFGTALAPQPTFTWSVDNGGSGTVSGAGLYSLPANATGSDTVRASVGSLNGTAAVTCQYVNQTPTVVTPASASSSTVTGTSVGLSVLGADDGGEPNLTYTWAPTGASPAGATFTANGTNAAKNTTITFTQAGTYNLQVTIADIDNLSVASNVTVTVSQTLTSITVSPAPATVQDGSTQQFTATALDQFGVALANQQAFAWSVDAGGLGTIDSTGLYSAPTNGAGSDTVRATSGVVSGETTVAVTSPVTIVADPTNAYAAGQPLHFQTQITDSAFNPVSYAWTVTEQGDPAYALPAGVANDGSDFTFTPLDAGTYSVMVVATDENGDSIASASAPIMVGPMSPTIIWSGGGDGSSWDDAANWSEGRVPGFDDRVLIANVDDLTVLSSGFVSIAGLICQSHLTISGGFSVSEVSQISGEVQVVDGWADLGAIRSSGMIQVGGGSVYLDGRLTLANLGQLTITSGSVYMWGELDLGGGAIDPDASGIAQWTFGYSGGIENGTITGSWDLESGTPTLTDVTTDGDITVGPGAELVLQGQCDNEGTLNVNGGTVGLGETGFYFLVPPNDLWSNTGTINVSGGTLDLGGSFAPADVGEINYSAGEIDLVGILDNTGNTLEFGTGSLKGWVLDGGTIKGGVIDGSLPERMWGSVGVPTLDGVTVDGDVDVLQGDTGIRGGMVLNGTLTVEDNAAIYFAGPQSLTGNGQLILNAQQNGSGWCLSPQLYVASADSYGYDDGGYQEPGELTLGPSITLRGCGDIYTLWPAGGSLLNEGTIQGDIDGGINMFLGFKNVGEIIAIGDGSVGLPEAGGVNGMVAGRISGVSSTEFQTVWDLSESMTDAPGTVSVSISTNGTSWTLLGADYSAHLASVLDGFAPGTALEFRVERDYSDNSRCIYQSDFASTSTVSGGAGWYKVMLDHGTNESTWLYAGSPEAAIVKAVESYYRTSRWLPYSDYSDVAMPGSPSDIYPNAYEVRVYACGEWNAPYAIDATLSQGAHGIGIEAADTVNRNAEANDASKDQSASGVSYFDGQVSYSTTDLSSDGFGTPFSQTRSWSNQPELSMGQGVGTGWINVSIPLLQQESGGGTIAVIDSASGGAVFNLVDGSYVVQDYAPETLVHADGQFILVDSMGNQTRFYDFSSSTPSGRQGQFISRTDRAGNKTYVAAWTTDGAIQDIRRQDVGGTDRESWYYEYLPSTDANWGLLSSVQLRRPDGNGGWTVVRQVAYAYYTDSDAYGSTGDLKTAIIEDGAGTAIDTDYYRYYELNETGGLPHSLKYVFDATSFARLAAAVSDPFDATDAEVAPFAVRHFVYDNQRRVVRTDVQGLGGSDTGGIGEFLYSYSTGNNPDGTNSWQFKTIETLPDGNQNIVYCNGLGEVMLKVFVDNHDVANPANEGHQWDTFYKYDDHGWEILEAEPSAVIGYDERYADLLRSVDGNYQYLSDSTGLIHITDFYTSTTATSSASGGVPGYLKDQGAQEGECGTPILSSSQDYYSRSANGVTIYPVADSTTYGNDDGTDVRVTSVNYTWYDGTDQIQDKTIIMPAASVDQNGSGASGSTDTFNDAAGRPIWTRDADGHVNYTAYDAMTGAVSMAIVDVDYSKLPLSLQNLFDQTGWSQPRGGLNLVTTHQVDALGRITETTDPQGNVSYTVYDDVDHEIRTYAGWNAATRQPTGPITVTRADRARNYQETLAFTWNDPNGLPVDTNGMPTGGESLTDPRAILQSLSRTFFNQSGQVVEVNRYFNLSGLSYSTRSRLGGLNTNYYANYAAYDALGNPSHTVNALGTITDTLYDALSRLVATYVGTNDSTNDGKVWNGSNGSSAFNMTEMSASEYDDGLVGDGDVTKVTQFPGSGQANRVTVNLYDWRDRLVATKAGAQSSEDSTTNRPLIIFTYDNQGEQLTQSAYDGDGISLPADGNDPSWITAYAADLRSYVTTSYDDLGRVYSTSQWQVDQTTGAIGSHALVTSLWYDGRGNVIKSVAPGGLVTKTSYDGAGRVSATYEGDGGGDVAYADAGNEDGDIILSETQNVYDGDGNLIETISRLRENDDSASAIGVLGDATNGPLARVSYAATYYDSANRKLAEVNVGTNRGTAWVRPGSTPDASDTVLVTSYTYNAAGQVDSITDPQGIVTRQTYDALGRVTQSIAAYVTGIAAADHDRITYYTYDGLNHIVTQTQIDPAPGISTTTQYNYGVSSGLCSNDLLASVDYPSPTTGAASTAMEQRFSYDALGEQLSLTQINGAVISSQYDILGHLVAQMTTTSDGSGNPLARYTYDTFGDVSSVTDPLNRTTEYLYDSFGREVETIQPSPDGVAPSPVTRYSYDDAGNTIAVTDARGNTTSFQYDLLNRKTQETDPDPDGSGPLAAPVTQWLYDRYGVKDVTIDARGNLWRVVYDSFGRTAATVQPSPDGIAPSLRTKFAYDRDGHVLSETDPRGSTTQFGYDLLGRKNQTIQPDPDGAGPLSAPVTSQTYDAQGNLLSHTDPRGFVTSYVNDAYGRVLHETDPDPDGAGPLAPPVTSYTYDSLGNLTGVTDPTGTQTTYVYNQLGEKISATTPDPDGSGPLAASTTSYHYDMAGNLVAVIDALGNATTYSYDNLNRKISETDPDPDGTGPQAAPVTQWQYDAVGNVTAVTDAMGHSTRYTYDALNRKISQIEPSANGNGQGGVTTYQYDADGNLVKTIDPLGNSTGDGEHHLTVDVYDNLNRLVDEYSPYGSGARPDTHYTYDANGNELSVTDPSGNTTSYVYDNLNRQINETNALSKTRVTAYDADGNVVKQTDRDGRVTQFIYDNDDRKTAENWLDANGNIIRTISYTYDAAGRMTQAADSGGVSTTMTYDAAGRLVTMSQTLPKDGSQQYVVTYGHDADNQITSIMGTIGSATVLNLAYTWDNDGRMTQLVDYADNLSVQFAYTALSQYVTVNRYADAAGTALVASTSYSYDQADRLTTMLSSLGADGAPQLSYGLGYDIADRVTQLTTADGVDNYTLDNQGQVLGASLTDEGYAYDANGNRTSGGTVAGADNRITEDASYTYTYDDEGNLLSRTAKDDSGSQTFTWDCRNRLTSVTSRDGQGDVVAATTYAYDAFDRRISKTTVAGGQTTVRQYLYQDISEANLVLVLDGSGNVVLQQVNAPGQDRVLAEVRSGGVVRWALSDQQGSVRDVIDNSGAVVNHIQYDTYGNILSQTNSAEQMLATYTGAPTDAQTGFVYLDHRYYDPAGGRFISQDPMSFGAGDTNLYRYVGNGPMNGTDPTGLDDNVGDDIPWTDDGGTGYGGDVSTSGDGSDGSGTPWDTGGDSGGGNPVVVNDTTVAAAAAQGDTISYNGGAPMPIQSAPDGQMSITSNTAYGDKVTQTYGYDNSGNWGLLSTQSAGLQFVQGVLNTAGTLADFVQNKVSNWFDGSRGASPSSLSPQARANALDLCQRQLDGIRNGTFTGSGAVTVLMGVKKDLESLGCDAQTIRDALAPYADALTSQVSAEYQQNRWYTPLERLEGSGSILANKLTFGATDKMNLTDSSYYQGHTFDGAYLGAGIAAFGEKALAYELTAGAAGGLGLGTVGSQFVAGSMMGGVEGIASGDSGLALAGDVALGGVTASATSVFSSTALDPFRGLCDVSPLGGRALAVGFSTGIGYGTGYVAGYGYGLATTGDFGVASATANQWGVSGAVMGAVQGFAEQICFVAGTQVIVAAEAEDGDGGEELLSAAGGTTTARRLRYVTKNIEEVRVGEMVVSRDQNGPDGPLTLSRVDRTYRRVAGHLQHVRIRSAEGQEQTLQTTDEHPFFVIGKGWTKAEELQPDDLLQEPDGSTSMVLSSIREEHPEGVAVFNLRVANTHSYFVRAEGSTAQPVWVHNANYRDTYFDANPELKQYENGIIVHHRIEQQVLDRYPGLFAESEIQDATNLVGIEKNLNSVHLSEIRDAWDDFYLDHPTATRTQIGRAANAIDKAYLDRVRIK